MMTQYEKIKCPDCCWGVVVSAELFSMAPCDRCNSTGYIYEPIDEPPADRVEAIAKWLFKKKSELPNPRFYARWDDEIAACPLTEDEYLKLAQQICSLFPEPKPDEVICRKMSECGYKHNCSHAKHHLNSDELCRGFSYNPCSCPKLSKFNEPKPDGGRLIDTTILTLPSYITNELDITEELKDQRDLTASEKDAECQARMVELWDDVICPMCYRLNPQHATMDNGEGCHSCQEREDWQALREGVK